MVRASQGQWENSSLSALGLLLHIFQREVTEQVCAGAGFLCLKCALQSIVPFLGLSASNPSSRTCKSLYLVISWLPVACAINHIFLINIVLSPTFARFLDFAWCQTCSLLCCLLCSAWPSLDFHLCLSDRWVRINSNANSSVKPSLI